MTGSTTEKKFNILAFFFAPGYYAGKGELKKGIMYAILGSIPVVFAISPFVAALKAKNLKDSSFSWGKAIGASALHGFLLLIVISSISSSKKTSKESAEITIVKSGALSFCPGKTVDEMVNGFFGSPKWRSGTHEGVRYVNVKGDMAFMNKRVKGELQFFIGDDNETFRYNTFEINGRPQGKLITETVFKKMCSGK